LSIFGTAFDSRHHSQPRVATDRILGRTRRGDGTRGPAGVRTRVRDRSVRFRADRVVHLLVSGDLVAVPSYRGSVECSNAAYAGTACGAFLHDRKCNGADTARDLRRGLPKARG